MNRITRYLASLLVLTGLFAGCSMDLGNNDSKSESPKAKITLSISNVTDDRTAMPSVDYSGYYYQLTSVDSDNNVTNMFSTRKTYTELGSASLEMALGTYSFVLSAYASADSSTDVTVIFSGIIENVDLTSDGIQENLVFEMAPATGSTGNVSVKFEILNDGTDIAKVYAGVATTPLAARADCDVVTAGLQSINSSDESNKYVTYSSNGLSSGVTQFVIFYLYDSNGNPVATIAESVIIVPGMTSTSTISRSSYRAYTYPVTISLYKNGSAWGDVRKVKLVDKNSINGQEFTLTKTSGTDGNGNTVYTFTGNVWTSVYDVWVQTNESNNYSNTYNTVDTSSGESAKTLYFYTATLTPGEGVQFTAAGFTPQADGTYLLIKGSSFNFTTTLKAGYNLVSATNNKITVLNNGAALANTLDSVDGEVSNTVSDISTAFTITSNDASVITYSISYIDSEAVVNGAGKTVYPAWVSGSVPSGYTTYTVANDFNLPGASDITCEGMLIDGWYISTDRTAAFSTIKAGTYHENLTLAPKWKKAEASGGSSSEGESSSGTVSSNGISFIIVGESGETHIYYDLDSDGVIDSGTDTQVKVTINGSEVSNFANYEITAESLTGAAIASNVLFTVQGGNIYSLSGLGATAANTSTLNISGNPIIGGVGTQKIVTDSTGDEKTYVESVHGIDLSTFTNEIVNITGTVSSAQGSIIMTTQYSYDSSVAHYVATMTDTSYAEAGVFNVYGSTKEDSGYPMRKLGKIQSGSNYVVRLANEASIIIPVDNPESDDSIVIVKDTAKTATVGFSFGPDKINTQCSVLSISATNGVFRLKQKVMYPDDSTTESSAALDYLGQYMSSTSYSGDESDNAIDSAGNKSYETSLSDTHYYVYMHVMATTTQFTEGVASDFLSNVVFIPDRETAGSAASSTNLFEKMTVKINIETVSCDKIAEMKTTYGSAKFSYFDGSFYAGVSVGSTITWATAYNKAKETTFNGLKGYLMTITSELENNYIINRMTIDDCWIGGSRILPNNNLKTDGTSYDSDITQYDMGEIPALDLQTYVNGYYWVCGPDAGFKFTEGNIPGNDTCSTTGYGTYGYNTCTKTVIESKKKTTYTIKGTEITSSSTSTSKQSGITCTPSGDKTINTYGYTNWANGEPNDSMGGNSEQCVHFYGSSSTDKGLWNDYDDARAVPKAYAVEFTPYTLYCKSDDVNDIYCSASSVNNLSGKNLENADAYTKVLSTSGTPDALPIKRTPTFNLNNY